MGFMSSGFLSVRLLPARILSCYQLKVYAFQDTKRREFMFLTLFCMTFSLSFILLLVAFTVQISIDNPVCSICSKCIPVINASIDFFSGTNTNKCSLIITSFHYLTVIFSNTSQIAVLQRNVSRHRNTCTPMKQHFQQDICRS